MTFAYKTIVGLKILGIRRREVNSKTERSFHFTTKHSTGFMGLVTFPTSLIVVSLLTLVIHKAYAGK